MSPLSVGTAVRLYRATARGMLRAGRQHSLMDEEVSPMPTIDCDAHVVESEQTWEFMEPADRKYRPRLVAPDGVDGTQYWVVGDKIRGLARQVMTSEKFA